MVLNGRSRFKEYIHECIHTYMYMARKVLKSCKIKMSVICIDEIMKTVCPPCYQHNVFLVKYAFGPFGHLMYNCIVYWDCMNCKKVILHTHTHSVCVCVCVCVCVY